MSRCLSYFRFKGTLTCLPCNFIGKSFSDVIIENVVKVRDKTLEAAAFLLLRILAVIRCSISLFKLSFLLKTGNYVRYNLIFVACIR